MNEQNMRQENLEIAIRMFCNDEKSLIIRRQNCQYVCSVERIRYHHCALFSLNQPSGGRFCMIECSWLFDQNEKAQVGVAEH
ncbi:hypothetical protein T4D_12915 [Trichinella pseudospiralis]|uniref:Uncharacterized protein n=1 Tax=Trichinella pseudospiralis TaxID=6337 RepID=A0A0V1FA82_TRIPS|nr:hypothetical protein T4D_12915 [Trichinella pseudospiralis]